MSATVTSAQWLVRRTEVDRGAIRPILHQPARRGRSALGLGLRGQPGRRKIPQALAVAPVSCALTATVALLALRGRVR